MALRFFGGVNSELTVPDLDLLPGGETLETEFRFLLRDGKERARSFESVSFSVETALVIVLVCEFLPVCELLPARPGTELGRRLESFIPSVGTTFVTISRVVVALLMFTDTGVSDRILFRVGFDEIAETAFTDALLGSRVFGRKLGGGPRHEYVVRNGIIMPSGAGLLERTRRRTVHLREASALG